MPEHDRLRIAHLVRAVFPQHGYGGLERAGAALTRHLLLLGAGVTLFTRSWPPADPPLVGLAETLARRQGRHAPHGDISYRAFGFRYTVLPIRANSIPARLTNYPLFVARMGRKVAQEAGQGSLDAVYAQGLTAYGVAAHARRKTPGGWAAPLIMNPQGMEDFKVRHPLKRLAYAPFRRMYALGARAADRVIATDESTRHEVSRFLGVADARVVVIPNGVDLDEIAAHTSPERQAALREQLGLQPGVFTGLSVARLEANKGLPYLLRALAALGGARPWRWIIVGSGKDRAALEAEAAALGIGGRVLFAGSLPDADLHNLYELCNLFGHSTLYEGSSLVTLEAMAHSRPVVATAAGGIPDKVIDGATGYLLAPRDVAGFSASIARCMDDPGACATMGQAGRKLVAGRFTWEEIARRTRDLCAELHEQAAGRRRAPARVQEQPVT